MKANEKQGEGVRTVCHSCGHRGKLNEYGQCLVCEVGQANDAKVWAWFKANKPECFVERTRGLQGGRIESQGVFEWEFRGQWKLMWDMGLLDKRGEVRL
jgi:hypothetical protein